MDGAEGARWSGVAASISTLVAFYSLVAGAAESSQLLVARAYELLALSTVLAVYSLALAALEARRNPLLVDLEWVWLAALVATGASLSLLYPALAAIAGHAVYRRLRLVEEECGARLAPRTVLSRWYAAALWPIAAPILVDHAMRLLQAARGYESLAALHVVPRFNGAEAA